MSIRRFKQIALDKIAVSILLAEIDVWLNASTQVEVQQLEQPDNTQATNLMQVAMDEVTFAAANWNNMFHVYRKKDKEFVGTFETEAEALAAIEKAKTQKKAALYLA